MYHPLGQRLAHLSSYYSQETEIWDIGCDHGFLGCSFLSNERVHKIYLVDPSSLVIETLLKKLKDSYITIPSKIDVINKKGQEIKIKNGNNKLIFIAGMGGKEIIKILDQLAYQLSSDDSIVISPHKNLLELRHHLYGSDYRLKGESLVFDNDRYYQALCLSLKSEYPTVSPFGDQIWKSSLAQPYKDYVLRSFKDHQDQLSVDFVQFLKNLSR